MVESGLFYAVKQTKQKVKRNITTQVFAQLEPKTGSLYVTSSPCCARVFLDGVEQGTTPLTITDIEEGWHEVVIIKEYYRAYVEYLYIYAGEETENPELYWYLSDIRIIPKR